MWSVGCPTSCSDAAPPRPRKRRSTASQCSGKTITHPCIASVFVGHGHHADPVAAAHLRVVQCTSNCNMTMPIPSSAITGKRDLHPLLDKRRHHLPHHPALPDAAGGAGGCRAAHGPAGYRRGRRSGRYADGRHHHHPRRRSTAQTPPSRQQVYGHPTVLSLITTPLWCLVSVKCGNEKPLPWGPDTVLFRGEKAPRWSWREAPERARLLQEKHSTAIVSL